MKLTILHLSDLHIHGSNDPILERADQIASTCFELARSSDGCLIVITGDIANSGSEEEYAAVLPFLSRIKESIQREGCPLVDILTVPGNHDCQLIPENKARSLLIAGVISQPENAEDTSVIDVCTQAQENYYIFRSKITEAIPVFHHKLWTEYEFIFCDKKVRFSAINASWMSRIPENSGQLVFPTIMFRDVVAEPCELRFALLHHPLNWYCQSSYHDLRTMLRTHATAILSGHEHSHNSGEISETNKGKSLYFESAALQPHEKNASAGYSILQFDLEHDLDIQNVHQYACTLQSDAICLTPQSDLPLTSIHGISQGLALTREFRKTICDPGGGFIHPDKENIEIDDIFVYPDLAQKGGEDKENQDKNSYSVSAQDVLFFDPTNFKLLITGEDKAGKTTLLLQAFKEYHNRGFAPIYLKANEVSTVSSQDLAKHILTKAEEQYINPEKFQRSEKQLRVVLIDDIDRLRGGLKLILKFITELEKNFDSIILSAAAGFEISELVNKQAAHVLSEYETYEITRFGHALRHQLIRKWCMCGNIELLSDLDREVHAAENLVNMVVGRNLVPSQPFYLLILLQSTGQNQQAELKNSSFAHYYEYLMTGNLTKAGVKRDEYDDLFNYLSHLAWFFRQSDIHEASQAELANFNGQYSNLFYPVDFQSRISQLIEAKLIKRNGSNYSFTYPYVFFFFLGRYLSKNLHNPQIKTVVTEWCSKLSKRNNAHAILFLTYHVNDPWVIEQIAIVLSKCFSDFVPIELNGDIAFIESLVDDATKRLVSVDSSDVSSNQEEVRKLRDQHDEEFPELVEEENDDTDEGVALFAKLLLLLKTGEILGQIVKNYYGSLERKNKKALIGKVFDAPLRFLRYVFQILHKDPEAFVLEMEKLVLLQHPDLKAIESKIAARNVAYQLLGQVCTGLVFKSAMNVSSEKLDRDIQDLIQENPTTAYKLIAAATKFNTPKKIPLDEIRRLAKDLKNNPFAFRILQSLGAMHIHQFHMKIEEKQTLTSLLGLKLIDSQVIDFHTKNTKLLKRSK